MSDRDAGVDAARHLPGAQGARRRSAVGFTDRLARVKAATGLNAQQLGIARVYDQPHEWQSVISVAEGNTAGGNAAEGNTAERNPAEGNTAEGTYSIPPACPVGALSGEEVLIKDLQQVKGELVGMGSVHQEFVAEHYDSAAVRLLRAGARLVGASTSAEYGTTAYTEPVGAQAPVNPLHEGMMTGGSSGGAAAAVARGIVDIAHATDGGGSIRIPAACVGLAALKPAHNNTQGGFSPTAHGFIARDLPTTARAYGFSAGETSEAALRGRRLRVGYTNTPFHVAGSRVDPAIAAATAAAAALLTRHSAVCSVQQAAAPYAPAKFSLFSQIIATRCADLPGQLSPITQWLREEGRVVPRWRREEMEDGIHRLAAEARGNWSGFDVVATPMLACAPPAPGSFSALQPPQNFWAQTAWTPWGTLWNLCGWASVTVPLVDPAEVPGAWPIALQLGAVSDRVGEAELLGLAALVQELVAELPAQQRCVARPGVLSDVLGDGGLR